MRDLFDAKHAVRVMLCRKNVEMAARKHDNLPL